ncbi:MAG: hypothetical protein GEU75_03355 [Dehalococcoidia bacterium]|nr:hypothetical protein [Dehalococcoidia bacterium]
MQWLDLLVSIEAGGDFILASLNCLYFLKYAAATRSPSRRLGAGALASLQGSLALEALLFLSQAPSGAQSWTRAVALVTVRSALLASTALVSLLIRRHLWLTRR